MNQARPDLDKRPKRGFETDDDRPEADTASGQADLYGMLGYRDWSCSSLTTQQWLAVRQIEL